jgi:hypothetical protein
MSRSRGRVAAGEPSQGADWGGLAVIKGLRSKVFG